VKELAPLLWIVAIAVIFWLLIIRPAQRRQREISQVQSTLTPGDSVVLTSGIFATIVEIDDDVAVVAIAPGVEVRVDRRAIASVDRDDAADEPDPTADLASEDAPLSTDDHNEER
jgi:preprotein translocase subunit YajC